MLSTSEVWNTVDSNTPDMPDHLAEHRLSKVIKQATHFLEKQGLFVV